MIKKVLLFDYDGTIVDSLDVAFRAYNMIAEEYSMPRMKSKEEFAGLYENNIYDAFIKLGLNHNKIKEFNYKLRDKFLECGYKPKLFNGIKKVVNQLHNTNRIIVITSNITKTIEESIEKANLDIHEVIGGDKETSKVKKILSVKKRYPSAELFYIGDTIGDIIEGKKAGIKTVGVCWGYHSRKMIESVCPDFIAEKAEDLLKIFE